MSANTNSQIPLGAEQSTILNKYLENQRGKAESGRQSNLNQNNQRKDIGAMSGQNPAV